MKKLSLAVGLLGLGMAVAAQAEIVVNPLLVFFSNGTTVQDITVTNDSNSTAYVQVTPNLVQNPGMASEKLTPYKTGSDASVFGLMISPLKMAIPANGSKKVRVVILKAQPESDVVYYLNFNPVASLAVDQSNNSGSTFQMSNGVSYRVQALILPMKPMPEVSITRQGTQVTVKNTGNSYASLRNGQICNAQGAACQSLPAASSYKVVYAGGSWNFTAPSAGVVKFDVVYNKDKKTSARSN